MQLLGSENMSRYLSQILPSWLKNLFLGNEDPKTLIVSSVEALEELANKSKTEMQSNFASIQEIINIRLNAIFENLNEQKSQTTSLFEFEDECTDD